MRIFKNKAFNRWAKGIGITNKSLENAVGEIERGLYDANIGGNVFKKRISLKGRGKSGGARTIVAFKARNHVFFIYGFAKNVRPSISDREETALKKLAKLYFEYSNEQLAKALTAGELFEV